MTEYESDGRVNTYVTEPAPQPSKRPATWMDAITPDTVPSPWTAPALSQLERKALGKLGEETNELSTVLWRIHIQGLDETIPGETKTNRQWLEEEIADSIATQAQVVKHFKLDLAFIEERAAKKTTYLEKWYLMPPINTGVRID